LRNAVALAGRFPALAGLDLDVAPGEAVLLQGPNGAGKTTLLRVCAGLVPLHSGDATVLDHDLTRNSERRAVRRLVGLIGHASFLYDELTAWENTRFWARAAGVDDDSAQSALVRMGIEGRLRDLPVGSMSAGQKRRVSIAAVVARRPQLWLLDEPHAGLDQDGRDTVDQLVRDATAGGATVMVASHELERARARAPRSITVAGGMVVADSAAPAGAAGAAASVAKVAGAERVQAPGVANVG
jgi:heme ABC exporter ATP-binding subunit CcmA